MTIAENAAHVREWIADAAARAGRAPGSVALVAVSKTVPAAAIVEAYAAGLRDFGENRVQEAVEKYETLAVQMPDARWHLIGHLQRNKVKDAIACASMIHSIDSLRLAEALEARCAAAGRVLPVLIEVNAGEEASKSGYRPSASLDLLYREAAQIAALPHLRLDGLMTVAPFAPDPEAARPVFARVRALRDDLAARLGRPLPQLSMGMSGDFRAAIAEGATLVRIGTAIFGERKAAA
ncbi:MAG: YggS family pyridoxal phosphate-dependent enzyme [Chloroflexi bacterium]|nr:YggS family pyridoxal phosphate-dependent enzyme [Chloroflexota bacterium]